MLSLVHRLLAEGQNLQQFCREAIGHFRNLLVARVCGADSELIAAPAEERPRLASRPRHFSAKKISLDFSRSCCTPKRIFAASPIARLHLEMGLLRMVNAARLAPLEEVLAELAGGAPENSDPTRSSSASAAASTSGLASARASAPPQPPGAARSSAPMRVHRRNIAVRSGRDGACANSSGAVAATETRRQLHPPLMRKRISCADACGTGSRARRNARCRGSVARATACDGLDRRASRSHQEPRSSRRKNFWANWSRMRRDGK